MDVSLNPENVDLTGARQLVRWDFQDPQMVAKWSPTNLKIERRGDAVFLVATGNDPQLATRLPQTIRGTWVIELKARPTKGAAAQFFWASADGGFNPGQQVQRQLNPAKQINTYLFRVEDDRPVKKLRFDPLSGRGEMEIESLSIYLQNSN
jgi:alpha-L-rhamnosidase